jgi:palmitoyltransferase
LIYLQGQIKNGLASAEDFPLNLWDMERVYEGVYQFLEFFAVLTESSEWKQLLVEWEIVYDLVTLIKELDASIPKASLTTQMPPPAKPSTSSVPRPTDEGTPTAIERPYYAVASAVDDPENPTVNGTDADLEEDGGPSPPLGTEEPSDFEWRNLKKLIVLVLSSLVWKSPLVQNQIRKHGGVEVILGCTQYDAHNPYIKEHAVMCLKFLLENNRANQEVVESLEARGVVGGEDLLREVGVEAVVNEEGKVRLVKTTQLQQRRPSEGAAREHASRRNVSTDGATEPSEGHGSGFVEELDE